MENLFRLIYTSSATTKMKEADIFDIIKKAQKNNKAIDITGLLLYIDGAFLQVLEGPEKSVKAIYHKISSDPRHENAKIILQGKIEYRDFSSWDMGLKIFTSQDIEDLKAMNNNPDFDLKSTLINNQSLAFEFMKHFYNNGEINFAKFWSQSNKISDFED